MATQADPRDIILAPVISEKSYGLIEDNVYTFLVHPDSNKTQIKIAVQEIFDVQVVPDSRAAVIGPGPGEPGEIWHAGGLEQQAG